MHTYFSRHDKKNAELALNNSSTHPYLFLYCMLSSDYTFFTYKHIINLMCTIVGNTSICNLISSLWIVCV